MVLSEPGRPLRLTEMPDPSPGPGQVLVRVSACAVCRTDLHVVDGELPNSKLPLVPGHEVIGRVEQLGQGVHRFHIGERIGIPWLGWTCGECEFCRSQRENLCEHARFTGYTLDGGFAQFAVADARFCFPIPDAYSDAEAAPLLCAGLIGYRSFLKTGETKRIGIYGFGAAAHILTQVAQQQGRTVFAFTRPGDQEAQEFARRLGAGWAGASTEDPPEAMDAAIIFAPVGALVPRALAAVKKGGIVVCGGIHMSDIPSFPYERLWHERTLCSVANLTRRDAVAFLSLVERVPVRTTILTFALVEANQALSRLRDGKLEGAAVLQMP